MIQKNITKIADNSNLKLVMCTHSVYGYEAMKFYVASFPMLEANEAVLVRNETLSWDLITMDDFKECFEIVTENENKANKAISWLKKNRHFRICIIPNVLNDGYWYDYSIKVGFPFNTPDVHRSSFDSYEKAAKAVVNIARKACLERHSKDGVAKWLEYCGMFKKS